MITGYDLSGRVAVVTGFGSGIGRATALALAGAGAEVVGLDLGVPGADRTVEMIADLGGRSRALNCDMGDVDAVRRTFVEIENDLSRVDILINCAARGSHTPPSRLTYGEFRDVIDVSLGGYLFAAQSARRTMIKNGGGSIVNISSIAGLSALGRGNLVYSLAKAAVNQMTRELAVEWAPDRVRVNAIAPSQVRTEGIQSLLVDPTFDNGRVEDRFLRGIPLGRLAEAGDIASAALFLACDASSFITGVVLPVDGGNTALNPGGTIGEQLGAPSAG